MRASLVRIYLALCIVAFAGIIAFFFVSLSRERDAARERSARTFISLQTTVERLWAQLPVDQAAAELAADLAGIAQQHALGGVPLLLAIVDPDTGGEYLWTIDPRLLPVAGLPGPGQTLVIGTDEILQVRYSTLVRLPEGERRELTAVFQILDQTAVFGVLRDTLIALLALLSLAVLVAIVSLLGGKNRGVRTARAPAPESVKPAQHKPDRNDPAPIVPTGDKRKLPEATAPQFAAELNAELERAAFHEQDVTCAIVDFTTKGAPDDYYHAARANLSEFLGQAGRCFAESERRELVVFPNMWLSDAIAQLERFQHALWSKREEWGVPKADIWSGLSSRNGRLVDGKRILGECMAALGRARKTGSRIVGFEPDPDRYRNYLRAGS